MPPRSEQADASIAFGGSFSGNDFCDVQPRKRRPLGNIAHRLMDCVVVRPHSFIRRFGRPGCALNRPTWSPIKGSSASVSTIRPGIVVRQRFFWIHKTLREKPQCPDKKSSPGITLGTAAESDLTLKGFGGDSILSSTPSALRRLCFGSSQQAGEERFSARCRQWRFEAAYI